MPSLRVSRVALLALAFVFGCDESIHRGWLVDRTRVLGVRVESRAEPSRASIAPGEPMRLTWLVGAPDGTTHLAWAFAVCPPVDGNYPEPRCEKPTIASGSGNSDGDRVVMELDAPPAAAVGDLRELQVLAAFCETGAPALDPFRFEATCVGGAAPLLAAGSIRLAAAGPNNNPEIGDEAVTVDGAPLLPASVRPGPPCIGEPSSPIVSAGSKHSVVLRFRGDEREVLPGAPDGVETVLATHVVTRGELKRQYSYLEPGDALPKYASVEWTAPGRDEVAEGGRLTELFFVLRDGRGGAAFARRTVCVRRDP